MVWWVDEYIDSSLRKLDLCPGVDVSFSFRGDEFDGKEKGVSVDIFWHSPSINLGWYPICQIDIGRKTVFHREGTENSEHWRDLLTEAADFFADAIQATETYTDEQ